MRGPITAPLATEPFGWLLESCPTPARPRQDARCSNSSTEYRRADLAAGTIPAAVDSMLVCGQGSPWNQRLCLLAWRSREARYCYSIRLDLITRIMPTMSRSKAILTDTQSSAPLNRLAQWRACPSGAPGPRLLPGTVEPE
ncbi:hypothetical protein LX36DRAFT_251513 [Colletotrichum falcatum]|nr:hypothetical protein LX36DRAFT_251513 [Colletotrichum falcatum]